MICCHRAIHWALALAGGVAAYFLASWISGGPSLFTASAPKASFPQRVETEQAQEGEILIGSFEIANRGGSPLQIGDFRTDCGCFGVERDIHGSRYAAKNLEIAPKSQETLFFRWSVRGTVGGSFVSTVSFRTNDPEYAQGSIDFAVRKIRGGAVGEPTQLLLGTPTVGEFVTKQVRIRDRSDHPRRATSVIPVGLPTSVKLRLHEAPSTVSEDDKVLGTVVATLEVLVDSERAGIINGVAEVHLAGDKPTTVAIPIHGEIVPGIRFIPSVLVLPRQSTEGPVYQGLVFCRSAAGEPIEIGLPDDSQGLRLSMAPRAPEGPGQSHHPAVRRLDCSLGH